jgi:hypothetical protein
MKTLSALVALSLLISSVVPAGAQVVRIAPVEGAIGASAAAAPSIGAALSVPGGLTLTPSLSAASLALPGAALSARPIAAPAASAAAPAASAAAAASAAPIAAAPAVSASAASAAPAASAAAPSAAAPSAPALAAAAVPAAPAAAAGSPRSRGSVSALDLTAAADGARTFDGAALTPAFEPPTFAIPAPELARSAAPAEGDNAPQRPTLSFQPAQKPGLFAVEPGASVYGTMKLVKDTPASREYWSAFSKGAEIDVVIRGENVFNRPVKMTSAVTKSIGELTREDFEGTVPAHMLQVGVKELRRTLLVNLEENRKRWSPDQPPVSLNSKVRVMKFESYLELFRQTHGPNATPEVEAPAARAALKLKPEGKLKPLSYILPRAVVVDLDMLEGPISKDLLSDMAKLQRTGVYFVAVSRKPYAAANSIKDKLVRQLSAYQLSVLMPIRFMMVTDDGAVISELPRGGSPEPVDVASFTPAEIDMLRDAAKKAAEAAGISPRAVEEIRQPPLREDYNERFAQKDAAPREPGPDPRVRFTVRFPKSATPAALEKWRAAYEAALKAYGLAPVFSASQEADGRPTFTAQRTDLAGSMGRLKAALGDKFGLYLNDGDALVLSDDKALMAANPRTLDVGKISGLTGSELVDNALGLMLGEHRDNVDGDLSGSATRIASFTRDRHRYLSESLIAVDMEEQNINFFSGHVVHAAEDWLIYQLQNGRIPTKEEFTQHLRDHWNAGMREFKAVGLPPAHMSEGWLNASLTRAESMYDIVVATKKRGEVLVGSEIPNFFVLKDYQRRSGEQKRRYILHTIFDFIALRPDPNKPGHATLVIYDFKTGPAKTRPKLNKDVQVLTYALFANEKWVGQKFPTPYLAGDAGYVIDDVSVEFIYNKKLQPTDVNRWSLDGVRRKIIGTLNRINAAERKLYGYTPNGKPADKKSKAKKPAPKKKGAKTPAKTAAKPAPKAKKAPGKDDDGE